MSLNREAYLIANHRHLQLEAIEAKCRNQSMPIGLTRPFLAKLQNGIDTLKHIRTIRIHVSFDVNEAPKNVRVNA